MEEILSIFKKPQQLKMNNPYTILNYFYVICISQIYFGYMLIYLSAIQFDIIIERYAIDFNRATAQGLFQGIMTVGGAIGALSSNYFINIFSRKNLIYACNVLAIILAILTLIPNYRIFFLVRLLQGITCGVISSVIPSIIKENSPSEILSITGTFSNLFIIAGLVYLYVFSYILVLITGDITGQSFIQLIFLFPVFMMALQSYLISKYYDLQTTKYLVQSNRYEELRQLLSFFYKENYVDQMYQSSIEHFGKATSSQHGETSTGQQKKHSRLALAYGIFYSFLCPLAGINIVMSYGGQCVSRIIPQIKAIVPSLLMIWYWLSSLSSILLIKKYGRKQLTLYGTLGISITLLLIAIGYFANIAFFIMAGLFGFLSAFGLTFAPIFWLWASEVLQPEKMGYAVMANWGGAALVTTIFPIVIEIVPNRNPGYIFLFFATYVSVSYMVTSKLMIQSKDKTQNEIRLQYLRLDEEYYGGNRNGAQNQTELHLLNR